MKSFNLTEWALNHRATVLFVILAIMVGAAFLTASFLAYMSLPIFNLVLKRITVRGSIVGTRQDLEEALAFAGTGAVSVHFSWDKLENINGIFERMTDGKIDGRIVVNLQ